jgi:hypothetical protein
MSKLTTQTLVAAVMVFGVSGVVIADTDGKHCTLGALDGLYVFSATGYNIVPGGPPQPKAITEFIRFNGDGTLTSPAATRSLNGVVAQFVPGGTGTYTSLARAPSLLPVAQVLTCSSYQKATMFG